MWIRNARLEEAAALAEVFWRAVREGSSPYPEAARAAWAPEPPSAHDFAARLEGLETVVAEAAGITGFMAMDAGGYLDMAFVLPAQRGQGVADQLLAVLESRARARRLPLLTTRASLMARSFFARQGWQVVAPDPVTRAGVVLDRFEMRKPLAASLGEKGRAAEAGARIFDNPWPGSLATAR